MYKMMTKKQGKKECTGWAHIEMQWDITFLCSAAVLSVLQVWCCEILCDLNPEVRGSMK